LPPRSAQVAYPRTLRDGKEIPGLGLGDCEAVKGDSIRKTVRFKDDALLKSIAGRAVRVKFELRDAKLYAFKFK
jgi:hypothetical protein